MKVFVYFNLHKKLWSVKAMEGRDKGKVIAHKKYIALNNVEPKVSQAGRNRVLAEGKKNVHAGMVGHILFSDVKVYSPKGFNQVTYNPYKYNTFVWKDSELEFEGSEYIYMDADTRSVHAL